MDKTPRIVPPVYFFGTLLAMAALHYLVPLKQLVYGPARYAGVVLVVAGIGIAAVAAASFARAGTPLVPFRTSTALVTSGPFRFTRNPMYLGMAVALCGLAVLLGSLTAFLPIPFFVWLIDAVFIRREERFMEELFGDEYLAYKDRVRRWL